MKKYPLISKLGLYILDKESAIGVVDVIHAEDLEMLLENATVVYQKRTPSKKEPYSIVWSTYENDDAAIDYESTGYKALLIGIEPIEQKKVTISKADLENALHASGNLSDVSFNNLCKELGL